jgi:hypothetical protein
MNQYFIEHKIKTLAELYEPFSFRGFTFEQWDSSPAIGPTGEAWRASKIIEAPNVDDAFKVFIDDFYPVVNRVAFVSQCFTMIELQPFIAVRLNDNNDYTFFFYGTKERRGVPLAFDADEIHALMELEKFKEKGDVFRFLREATNATSFYTRFAMLTSSIEAMAGEIPDTKGNTKITNKEYISRYIIQDEKLYDNIFGYRDGLRNVISHGNKPDLNEERHEGFEYIRDVYQSILKYFSERYAVEINTRVINRGVSLRETMIFCAIGYSQRRKRFDPTSGRSKKHSWTPHPTLII